MNVYLINDCFRWSNTSVHYGCKAIMDSLCHRIGVAGHNIIAVCKRPMGPVEEHIRNADMLIVNGEGTFRDEGKNWEACRHDRLFNGMTLAKVLGKRVYLVNALWCRMSDRWAPLLASLDGISVREPQSAEEIRKLCGVTPEIHPDESFFLETDPAELAPDCDVVVGDFYSHNSFGEFGGYPRLGLLKSDWSTVVNRLRTAAVYVTGQHHGVYAAIKANCPFAVARVNTHKLSSLFEWAGVNIPLATNLGELKEGIRFARKHPEEFLKLNVFLEKQTPWTIPVS